MLKISGIYTITNITNNKIYVGYSKDVFNRKISHYSTLLRQKHANEHLQRAYNKYGKQNIIFEVLEECEEKYLASQENYWCNMLNVHNINYGYNIDITHPDNKKIMSEVTKEKLRQINLGKKLSDEHKEKIGNSCKGKTLGRKATEECKRNMSKARKGKYTGKNNPFYGKKHTNESKNKIKNSEYIKNISGENNPNFGNKWNILQRKNLSEKKKIKIIQLDMNEKFIKEWDSADNASKKLKLIRQNITACCKGRVKSCGNFKWKYKNENILT